MYGIAMSIAVFFRPNLSAKMPDGTAPTMAPIGKNAATHVSWSPVTLIIESGADSWLFTGDVHDSPVPAAAALMQTITQFQNENKQKKIVISLFVLVCFAYFRFHFFCLLILTNKKVWSCI